MIESITTGFADHDPFGQAGVRFSGRARD